MQRRFRPRKDEAEIEQAAAGGHPVQGICGHDAARWPKIRSIIDDLNHHEAEVLMEKYKPDIFCAGIKEKYVIQKGGVPLKQLHSYDYSGPYAGFKGAINFYREIDRMVNSNVFRFVKAPWQENPELAGSYGWNQ